MEYSADTIFVVGAARAGSENPITVMYANLILAMVMHKDTHVIVDAEVNSICDITSSFVRQLLVGKSLTNDFEALVEGVNTRYVGSSRKAIVNCLKDAKNRLATLTK